MQRGEVWWAELPPPVGPRPVLILTRNAVVNSIGAVVVGVVTRTVRNLNTEVELGRREGLAGKSVLNLDNLLTVPRSRLTRLLGSCSREKLLEVNRALSIALGLAEA